MIFLYRLIFIPLLLLLAPYYLCRMIRRGGYGRGFSHRFGWVPNVPKKPGKKRIWIQAVSVGEIKGIQKLIEKLVQKSDIEIYLTCTTSTGFTLAQELYQKECASIAIFPLDFWWISAMAWRRIQPDLALLMEGERWPEHIHQGNLRKVPVIVINGRISDKSYPRYQTFLPLTKAILRGLSHVVAASEIDFNRFKALGVAPHKLILSGNIKFDSGIPELPEASREKLLQELHFTGNAQSRTVILGSSTWPGEEALLLEYLHRQTSEEIVLLLVPRHVERRQEIEAVVRKFPFPYALRTRPTKLPVKVYVGDTTGELAKLTALADIVVVGKSFAPNSGGQSPLEAAAYGKAIILGPNMQNFKEIVRGLVAAGGALQVALPEQLPHALTSLISDKEKAHQLGKNAQDWYRQQQGATDCLLQLLNEYIKRPQ